MAEKIQAVLPKPSDMTADEEDVYVLGDSLPPLDFEELEELAHAPPTSHGTYLDGISEGLEPLEGYQEGGYHPVHLSDTLGSAGRYRVIHKLGHGGFGTVWLFRDLHDPGYVAAKIVAGNSGDDLPASSPTYLVPPADTSRLSPGYLTDQICVIDFGESFQVSSPPADLGIPETFSPPPPPEVLLDRENAISQACDIWAPGCALFEIREQMALFYIISDRAELLAEIVHFFGKPPREWWDRWDAWEEFFDDDGVWLRHKEDKWSLEVALSKPTEAFPPGAVGGEAQRSQVTPEAEREMMADLLYKVFRYDSRGRPSAEEILTHEWFRIKKVF